MTVRELCHAMDAECDSPFADFTVVVHVERGTPHYPYKSDTYEVEVIHAGPSNLGRPTFVIRTDA